MQIIKPMRLGAMTKAIPDRPRSRLAITGLLCFDLLDPTTILTEQAMWDAVTPFLGEQGALDSWTPKRNGEVLLWGHAAAAGAIPVKSMQVSVAVGEQIHKTLSVHGDRHWESTLLSAKISDAKSFASIPLTYARAFGGPFYALNPVGAGYDAVKRLEAGELVSLPNVEYPGNPLLHPKQEPLPAALMPVSLEWPCHGPGGTYDNAWRKYRYPAMPVDFDWQAYNVAPQDQQIHGYFQGNESLALTGFHPDHPRISSRLPAMTLRFFTRRKECDDLQESSAVLDTVCLFPSVLCGVLVYRSEIELPKGDDLQHIAAIMLACEASGAPRSRDHYEEVFRLRTGDDRALHALSDFQLMPEFSEATRLRLDERREEVRKENADARVKKDAWFAALATASVGFTLPDGFFKSDRKTGIVELPIITDLDRELGNVDMASIKASADRITSRLMGEAEQLQKDAALRFGDLERKSEILEKAQRSGDYAPILAMAAEDSAADDGAAQTIADALRAEAERVEIDSSWSLSQAAKSLAKSFQTDAFAQALKYEILSPEDKAELIAAQEKFEGDADDSGASDTAHSRAQFSATLRQVADALSGSSSIWGNAAATEKGDAAQALASMGLGGTAESMPKSDELLKALGIAFRDGPPESPGAALVAAVSQLPGMAAVDWGPIATGLDQAAGLHPELLREIGHGFSESPDPQSLREQAGKAMEFLNAKTSLSEITDETQRSAALAQLQEAQSAISKRVAALAPDAVRDGEVDWNALFEKMGVGDIPPLPQSFTAKPEVEPAQALAMRKASSLALGLPGVYRLGPDLPAITPEEVHSAQMIEEYIQDVDPAMTKRSNAIMTDFLQATQDADAKGGGLNFETQKGVIDQTINRALRSPSAESSPTGQPGQMGKILAVAYSASTIANSIMRDVLPDSERILRAGRQGSPLPLIQAADITPEIGLAVGILIRQEAARGESLAGRDLAGANLQGARLAGIDLTGAFLEYADLSGADLSGAMCEGAVFAGACLEGAKLHGAMLDGANFGQAKALGADFSDARMDNTNLYQANFNAANFHGASLNRCNALQACFIEARLERSHCDEGVFIEADMTGACLNEAAWHKSVFMKAKLNGIRAERANLKECVFADSEAIDCDFSEADLNGLVAVKSAMRGLLAVGAKATGSGWAQCELENANFSTARLEGACFMAARLDGADFSFANLRRAMLLNAILRSSCMDGAQLYEASLRGADLTDASLRQTNLHKADLANAILDRADMTGARLLDTNLGMPSAGPKD